MIGSGASMSQFLIGFFLGMCAMAIVVIVLDRDDK